MQSLLDYLLPSLDALGLWGYWVVALFVFLQGFAPTSPLSPASVLVVFVGGLTAQGVYDFWDMVWFVGVADILGAELTLRLGRHGRSWLERRNWFIRPEQLIRVQHLFDRFGPAAILIGRFVPMGAFVPLLAGATGMDHRRFVGWNVAGGFLYGVAALALGYGVGTALPAVGAAAGLAGLVILVVALAIALIWWGLVQLRRIWPFLRSILGSVAVAIAENEDVRALTARHPALFAFLGRRLHRDRFTGLPTTVLALAFFYFLTLYASLTLDVLFQDTITALDTRLASLFYAVRDPGLVQFFTWITALGAWRGEAVIAAVVAVLLSLGGRGWQVPVLWIGLAGNAASVQLLKILFARPRPELAVYVETGAAFPSGHAAVSVALFGWLAYVLVRERVVPVLWALLPAAAMVFLIGLSRLYLVEHYFSDVLNGYVVGTLWLLAMIWVLEWQRPRWRAPAARAAGRPVAATRARLLQGLVLVLGLAGVVLAVEGYRKALNVPPPVGNTVLSGSLVQAFGDGMIAAYTESALGERQEPVSLIILAADSEAVAALFAAAGWQRADPPGLETLGHAALAAWLGQSYPTAPITPGFWAGRPHDMGFQMGTGSDSLRQRHHARLWDSRFRTADGREIFVGSASYDDGLKWALTHRIDPNIDAERDFLGESLVATGRAEIMSRTQLTTPILGKNMTGDPFFTDGMALLIELTAAP